jgi:hypothetical protein
MIRNLESSSPYLIFEFEFEELDKDITPNLQPTENVINSSGVHPSINILKIFVKLAKHGTKTLSLVEIGGNMMPKICEKNTFL